MLIKGANLAVFFDSFCACFSLLTCCMTLCGFNWHTITHRNFFPPTMPEVVFGLTAAWIPSDFISIWFSIRSCEVGAALKASCQLVWGSKGEIDRKLPLYYQAGNMCFFYSKMKQVNLAGRCRDTFQIWGGTGGEEDAAHVHRTGCLLEVQT